MGPVRVRQGSIWHRMGPKSSRTPIRDSRVFHRGSSGPVGPYRVPTETLCFGTAGPDGARRIERLSRIGARLIYGAIWDPIASPQALRGPIRSRSTDPRRTAGGTVGPHGGKPLISDLEPMDSAVTIPLWIRPGCTFTTSRWPCVFCLQDLSLAPDPPCSNWRALGQPCLPKR